MRFPLIHCRRGLLVAILPFLGSIGCGIQASKQAAELTVNRFYQAVANQNWDLAVDLCDTSDSSAWSKEPLLDSLKAANDKLGQYKDHTLRDWRVESHIGSNGSQRVTRLVYVAHYAKGSTVETFIVPEMSAQKAGSRISGYRIEPASISDMNDNKVQ